MRAPRPHERPSRKKSRARFRALSDSFVETAMIDQQCIRDIAIYDPETGTFTLKVAKGRKSAGSLLGSKTVHGYVVIGVNGHKIYAHRLAWLYVYGFFPKEIDHINRDRSDNRLSNLRSVSRSENNMNATRKTTTGHIGVWRNGKKYSVVRRVSGKRLYLGSYASFDDAVRAYNACEAI